MSNNQYKPPQARVADPLPSARGPRPVSIWIALALIVLFVLVECYHVFARMGLVNSGDISGAAWLGEWILVGLIVAVGIFIARGRGWARWVLLAMMLYQLYQLADALLFLSYVEPGSMSLFMDPVALWMLPLSALFSLGAVILVFGPGRGWFSRES
jgi:hypothetical protein